MWLLNTEWERDGKTLDLDALSKGPKPFLPRGRNQGRLDELMEFLGRFVAKSEGKRRIGALMKKNRGAKYVPNLFHRISQILYNAFDYQKRDTGCDKFHKNFI